MGQGHHFVIGVDDSLDFHVEVIPLTGPVIERIENPLMPVVGLCVGQPVRFDNLDIAVGVVEDELQVATRERIVSRLNQFDVLLRHRYSDSPAAWRASA
jgi:hypothetical protein